MKKIFFSLVISFILTHMPSYGLQNSVELLDGRVIENGSDSKDNKALKEHKKPKKKKGKGKITKQVDDGSDVILTLDKEETLKEQEKDDGDEDQN